jgi:hypothetical protein
MWLIGGFVIDANGEKARKLVNFFQKAWPLLNQALGILYDFVWNVKRLVPEIDFAKEF